MSETCVEYNVGAGNEPPQNKQEKPMQKLGDFAGLAMLVILGALLLPLLAPWAMLAGLRLEDCNAKANAMSGLED